MVLVIFAAGSARAEKLLRLKFQPGEVRNDQLVQEMSQSLRPAGDAPPMLITTTQTMDLTLKVESVDEQGTATLTQTIERIRMKMQSAQGVLMEFDSAAGKEPEGMAKMLSPMLDAMIKKPIHMQLTTRGEVRDMKLPQGMLEGMNKVGGGGQSREPLLARLDQADVRDRRLARGAGQSGADVDSEGHDEGSGPRRSNRGKHVPLRRF